MIEEYRIKNSDIVTVYLYTYQYQCDSDKESNEYPFDSATIFFKKLEKAPKRRLVRKNHINTRKKNNLVCEIGLNMRYDTAMQFLKRLHFSPTIGEADCFTEKNGESIFIIKEYWNTDVKEFEKCVDLTGNPYLEDTDDLPF